MTKFKFNGDWEFNYQFEAFKGLQSRRGSYTSRDAEKESNGTVNVTISDELNDETDPTEEQINAINYIIENSERIKQTLFKVLEIEYPKLKKQYGYDAADEYSRERFPKVDSTSGFKNVFGVGNMFVLTEQKEGVSYVGLECGCTWDEEHGLGFMLHKNRVVKIGAADEAFSSWEASKDNGTYEEKQKEWDRINMDRTQLPPPKVYEPNSKYGKLSPLQILANQMYENHLIERGYNQQFIDLVESGKVDINVNKGLSMTFLARAAQFNNFEIVKFILSQNPDSKKNVIHSSVGHCNKELVQVLVENGVDINEPDHSGRTILKLTGERILQARRNGNQDLNKYLEFENWIKKKGAK